MPNICLIMLKMDLMHVRCVTSEENSTECEVICHKSSKMKTKIHF
jgi:hypothetical protein